MRQSLYILIVFLVLASHGFSAEDKSQEGRFDTWMAPSPQLQMYIEGEDDRKGLGRIFVPAMTNGANEPLYAVFKDDEEIGQQNTGTSFFLAPGTYTVVFGSGNIDQRIHREVEIQREETVIITPNWSALTVEVLDELRNYYPQDLQIYRVETAESYGIIPSINPELGEHLRTQILQPGLYKIVIRGEDFNTWINFTTVLLEPGSYTPFTIVINSETKDFIGAGILAASSQLRQRRDWKIFGAVHGNVNITGKNDKSSKDVKINSSLLTQLENRLLYDKFPHYYQSNNLLEFGALRQEDEKIQINQDRLRLKNTYVYYILNWIGGYSRLGLTTHLFERFEHPENAAFIEQQDTTWVEDISKVRLEPSIYPLEFKEGIGINVTPVKTFNAHLNLRLGLGYWQTYNEKVYSLGDEVKHTIDTTEIAFIPFKQADDVFQNGLETALVSNLSPLHNLSITTELEILFPFSETNKPEYELENFINLRVAKGVAIEHTLRLKNNPDPQYKHIILEQFISVRFSYFLY